MALSISEVLDKVIAREDVKSSINSMTTKASAVGQLLDAVGNPIRNVTSPVQAYSSFNDVSFSTWDNSSAKTSQSLAGDVGEITAATAYAIVAYPKQYETDIESFSVEFSQAMANGFAKYIDSRVLNTATIGVVPAAIAAGNEQVNETTSPTSYQLYSDLVATMGLVNADGFMVNGVLSSLTEDANLLNSLSTTGQPIFSTDANGNVARVLGRPYAQTFVTLSDNGRFVVGDWSKVSVMTVGSLQFETFNSGIVNISGTPVNLIEANQVAVRAEVRMLFKVLNANAFGVLTSA